MIEATPAITFTLAEIRKYSPCKDGWKLLCQNLGGIEKYGEHTPITARQIYESNGAKDLFLCLQSTPKEAHYLWRHIACDCALLNEHLITDELLLNCIKVARKLADGLATVEELDDAWDAACDAAWCAARATARVVSWDAACYAARATAKDAEWDAAWAAQFQLLELYCQHGKRPENSAELLKQFYNEAL